VLLIPLFFFVAHLWVCREEGWSAYLQLATRYVSAFDDKWVKGVPAEKLLGTSDLQSLADLGNSLRVVREMQWVPIPLTLLRDIGIAGIVPFFPLVLMKYPIAELAQRFLTRLASF
jgi:hypothetical protein